MRPRIAGKDDLFSNYHQTTTPTIALFLEFEDPKTCVVMLEGQNWSVDTKNIKHNTLEVDYVG
jgi:hypothetical protein